MIGEKMVCWDRCPIGNTGVATCWFCFSAPTATLSSIKFTSAEDPQTLRNMLVFREGFTPGPSPAPRCLGSAALLLTERPSPALSSSPFHNPKTPFLLPAQKRETKATELHVSKVAWSAPGLHNLMRLGTQQPPRLVLWLDEPVIWWLGLHVRHPA